MVTAAYFFSSQGIDTVLLIHSFLLFRKHIPGIPRRNKEDDTDLYLAKSIMKNKQYSMSGRADNEYDYEDGSGKTTQRKRGSNDDKLSGRDIRPRRMATQEERCIFCFENPNRPKHLTVSIANCTYLMLPQWQPVVTGHCCILPISVSLKSNSLCILFLWVFYCG